MSFDDWLLTTQAALCGGAIVCFGIAAIAGWRDYRRIRRRDPDAIGLIDWPTLQMASLLVAVILAGLALRY